MFTKLLATTLIAFNMGMGSFSSPFNHIKKANNDNRDLENFELIVEEDTSVSSSTTITDLPESLSLTCYSTKLTGYAYNTALIANTSVYIQTTVWNGAGTNYAILPPTSNNIEGYTTMLYIAKLNPYKNFASSTIDIQFYYYLSDGQFPLDHQINANINIQTRIITTLENLDEYLDISNYMVYKNNKTIYDTITSPENGYLYNDYYQEKTITADGTNKLVNFEQSIDILKTNDYKPNYVAILIEPKAQEISDSTNNISKFEFNSRNNTQWANPGGNLLTISGQEYANVTDYEVIDLPGLLWQILTMPFTFISTAFNLTLFPGTPYQVNISNLFLTIIGVLVFIYILKKIKK